MLDLCGVAGAILTRQGVYIFIPENRGLLRNLSYRQRGHLGRENAFIHAVFRVRETGR